MDYELCEAIVSTIGAVVIAANVITALTPTRADDEFLDKILYCGEITRKRAIPAPPDIASGYLVVINIECAGKFDISVGPPT